MTHDTLLRIQTLVQVERFAYKFISPGNILLACRIPMIFPDSYVAVDVEH